MPENFINTKKNKIVSFGEILLRFSPDWKKSFSSFFIGGSEANVAACLANFKNNIHLVTCMPENELAEQMLLKLNKAGIHTQDIIRNGQRIGIYFLAQGKDLKNTAVIYDRKFSSFSNLKIKTVDWNKILTKTKWFHWSAISPGLNKNIAAVCEEALSHAKEKNIITSVDLNYRSKLWQYGKQPLQVMPSLVENCTVVMGNIWSANKMLGTTLPKNLNENNWNSCINAAKKTSFEILEKFPHCKHVALTFRFSNSSKHNLYFATYFENGNFECSKQYETNKVVDRIGSGDSFMAGLIHAIDAKMNAKQIVEFATAAGFSKFFVKGDFNTATKKEILKLVNS